MPQSAKSKYLVLSSGSYNKPMRTLHVESYTKLKLSLFDHSTKCLEFSLDLGLLCFPLQIQNGVASDTSEESFTISRRILHFEPLRLVVDLF